jgi:hypothetical protein
MHQLQSWHNCVVLQTTMTIAKMATMWMLHNLWLRNSLELSKKMLEHFVLDLPAQKRKFRCMMQQFSWPAVWENLQITGKHSDPSWAAPEHNESKTWRRRIQNPLSLSLCVRLDAKFSKHVLLTCARIVANSWISCLRGRDFLSAFFPYKWDMLLHMLVTVEIPGFHLLP